MNIGSLLFVLISILASSSAQIVDPSEAGLYFYFGPTADDNQYYSLENATSLPDHPQFVHPQTHIYIHGYGENQKNESVLTIVDAYLSSGRDINLVTVDYAKLVATDYLSAVTNMNGLAPVLASTLLELFNGTLDRNSVTVVGHSLGGQLAGHTAREIKTQTSNIVSLPKVFGLDPAFPGFLPQDLLPFMKTLSSSDADFVCIIHTDAPNYSSLVPVGHIDFYPNGGLQGQPGCPSGIVIPFSKEDLCSHQRSWRYWAEDIKYLSEPKFYGYPALSYASYLITGPQSLKGSAVIMGNDCPVVERGTYYLQTNAATRFARGLGN